MGNVAGMVASCGIAPTGRLCMKTTNKPLAFCTHLIVVTSPCAHHIEIVMNLIKSCVLTLIADMNFGWSHVAVAPIIFFKRAHFHNKKETTGGFIKEPRFRRAGERCVPGPALINPLINNVLITFSLQPSRRTKAAINVFLFSFRSGVCAQIATREGSSARLVGETMRIKAGRKAKMGFNYIAAGRVTRWVQFNLLHSQYIHHRQCVNMNI